MYHPFHVNKRPQDDVSDGEENPYCPFCNLNRCLDPKHQSFDSLKHYHEHAAEESHAVNIDCYIVQHTLLRYVSNVTADTALCIGSFCYGPISYAMLYDPSPTHKSSWPSLTMENDNAFIGFTQSSSCCAATFTVSYSLKDRSGTYSEWRTAFNMNSQRVLGVSASSIGRPMRLRLRNERGDVKEYEIADTQYAVFGSRKGRTILHVNGLLRSRTVRRSEKPHLRETQTVLCGDEAISGALCDRFRLRFRFQFQISQDPNDEYFDGQITGSVSGFSVGYVISEPMAILANGYVREHQRSLNPTLPKFGRGTDDEEAHGNNNAYVDDQSDDDDNVLDGLDAYLRTATGPNPAKHINEDAHKLVSDTVAGFLESHEDAMCLEQPLGGEYDSDEEDFVYVDGYEGNEVHSVGIYVYNDNEGGHNSRDEDHCTLALHHPELDYLEVTPDALSDVTFPESGQEWLIEFDFVKRHVSLYLCVDSAWVCSFDFPLCHRAVIPAFSFWQDDEELELV